MGLDDCARLFPNTAFLESLIYFLPFKYQLSQTVDFYSLHALVDLYFGASFLSHHRLQGKNKKTKTNQQTKKQFIDQLSKDFTSYRIRK